MNLEGLIVKLQIEEDNRNSEKKISTSHIARANIVVHNHGFNSNNKNSKTGKGTMLGPNSGIFKKPMLGLTEVLRQMLQL